VQFALEQEVRGGFDDVLAALVDPRFLDGLGALPNLGPPVVLDLSRSDDGRVLVPRVRYRFTGSLPSAVTRVVDPSKLTWIEETTYDVPGRRASFTIVPDHYAGKLRCRGSHTFVESNGTTTRRIDADLSVSVPIVGRRVEKAIVSGLREHFDTEGALLGAWLHAPEVNG
jgi:hypothetical protein